MTSLLRYAALDTILNQKLWAGTRTIPMIKEQEKEFIPTLIMFLFIFIVLTYYNEKTKRGREAAINGQVEKTHKASELH